MGRLGVRGLALRVFVIAYANADQPQAMGGSFVRSPHFAGACQKPFGFKTIDLS